MPITNKPLVLKDITLKLGRLCIICYSLYLYLSIYIPIYLAVDIYNYIRRV